MARSWFKGAAGFAMGLLLVVVAWVIRNHTDGKIPVTFVIGPAGVGGRIFIDDQFLGIARGARSPDGSVARDWRIKLGRHTAQLVTLRGDTLRETFVADESALVELARRAPVAKAPPR